MHYVSVNAQTVLSIAPNKSASLVILFLHCIWYITRLSHKYSHVGFGVPREMGRNPSDDIATDLAAFVFDNSPHFTRLFQKTRHLGRYGIT
jgi:hypothetical protein